MRNRGGVGWEGQSGAHKSDGLQAHLPAEPNSPDTLCVYTPKHTSWLKQVELWFSILLRRLLKRGSFNSVEELHQRISWSSSSTTTELWPNRSSGLTRADRSRSKPMGYLHRDALV